MPFISITNLKNRPTVIQEPSTRFTATVPPNGKFEDVVTQEIFDAIQPTLQRLKVTGTVMWSVKFYDADVIRENTGGGGGVAATPGYVVANAFPGADIGAQINAAMASLPNGGTVVVFDGNYAMFTRVVVGAGVTLQLGRGTYSNAFAATGGPIFLLKDDASLIGAGWATKVQAPQMLITDSGVSTVTDFVSATDNAQLGNKNLLVRDIQFIRNPASTTTGVQSAAVQFGNIKNAVVDHCFFNGCEGYGVFQASSSVDGFHGDGFVVKDCVFENITTQQCGVINCANWSIRDNLFRPTTATANFTVIDCESNTAADVLRNWEIKGNIFDFPTNPIFNPGSMIQVIGGGGAPPAYKSAHGGRATYGVISDNVCVAGDFSTDNSVFAQGINLAACDEVTISNNRVFGASLPISIGECNAIEIHDNATGYGKNNEGWHILLQSSFDCVVRDNKCAEHFGAGWSTPRIAEQGSSDYNIFQNNHVAFYPYTDTIVTGGRYATIDLLGAHSRVLGGVMGPVPTPVDAPLVTSTAELRALDIPGTRPTAAPAIVVLGGRTAQADGGMSLWKYDRLSTLTDNDITVVKPSNAAAQWDGVGRWLRAPSTIHLTTTARDALVLTAADAGLSIWNTTTAEVETWNGTAWVGSSAGGGSTGFDFADWVAHHPTTSSTAGNLTTGIQFQVGRASTATGVKVYWAGPATTLRVRLYDAGGVSLATGTLVVTGPGTYTIPFGVAVAMLASTPYWATLYDTSGADYTAAVVAIGPNGVGTTPVAFLANPGPVSLTILDNAYASGDVVPATPIGTQYFGVMPIYTTP